MDLAESSNLYLTSSQGRLFEAVLRDREYIRRVSEPLAQARGALPHLWRLVSSAKDRRLTIIECGPAASNETVETLRLLSNAVKIQHYVGVDVNQRILRGVIDNVASRLAFPVTTLNKRFEDLTPAAFSQVNDSTVLVIFGGTCMNYEPDALRCLLEGLCRPGWFVALESLVSVPSRVDANEYKSGSVVRFAFGPLDVLGAGLGDFDFEVATRRRRVELSFIARRQVRLGHPGIPILHRGDRVVTAFSRRPSASEFVQERARLFRHFSTAIVEGTVAISIGKIGGS